MQALGRQQSSPQAREVASLEFFEAEEFICNIDSVIQHVSERERAEKAVESAEPAVTSAQNAITDL